MTTDNFYLTYFSDTYKSISSAVTGFLVFSYGVNIVNAPKLFTLPNLIVYVFIFCFVINLNHIEL